MPQLRKMRAVFPTPVSTPHTRALLALKQNLDSFFQIQKLMCHQLALIKAQVGKANQAATFALEQKALATKPGNTKLTRSLNRLDRSLKTLDFKIEGFQSFMLWQVVMLVACFEAYLQDVLSAAASADLELMSKSEQRALYSDVIAAASVEELANKLRAQWARGWVSDGGPSRWIERLGKMGARGYPKDLGPRLERFWGIRHVVVHAAGVATAEFVKRHPGVVKGAGNRVRVGTHDLKRFFNAIVDFVDPTDAFFLKRYPSLLAVSTAPAK